jgi:beta-phosphoglucomutase-like phosphatase (HAD superfamily)
MTPPRWQPQSRNVTSDNLTAINLGQPAAWIFDLDGTLVDTLETWIVAWLRTFKEQRIPAYRAPDASLIGSDGRRLAHVVAEAADQASDSDREEEIDRRAGEIYSDLNIDPKTLPGALELLNTLDEHRQRWAIATKSALAAKVPKQEPFSKPS